MSAREQRPNKLNSRHIKELNKRLTARRKTGETLTEIAAAFGVTHQTVAYHASKLPPSVQFKPVRPQVDEAEVLRLYGIHMNQSVVAGELGVPLKAVSRALARMEWKAAA
jgi:hypothetical protein